MSFTCDSRSQAFEGLEIIRYTRKLLLGKSQLILLKFLFGKISVFICTGSPPIGSYDGYWHVSECTRRVTSQNLCMKVNPYCGQASKSLRRMFRTGKRVLPRCTTGIVFTMV